MAILKHIASKSSNYGAALEYLIFKHDELRKTPILDQNGNRIMRDEFYLDGLNCEPYSFDAACQQLNREYQKNKNKNEIKSHHYIISFDPRDSTENCLTGKRAQELGLEYAKANFPGHQALVCTHMDGHNGSGNIHVHIVINSLRKLDVPQQPFMERSIDCKAGYKHHVTNEYLKHLQKSLMDLCNREFLHQVDLLSPSRTGVTEAEYWAQRRLNEKKQEVEKDGFTPNPTKFQTQKQLIRDAVAVAREKAISYEDFQNILQDEYNIFVKTQRGRYSYLPPERNKFISERSLGESSKRESTAQKCTVEMVKNEQPDCSKVSNTIAQNCTSNQINKNNLRLNQLSRTKEAYGRYRNVYLEDYSELKMEIAELDSLIDDLSIYMQSTGRKYADHAATLRSWSARKKRQQKPGAGIPDYTYNKEESL